MEISGRAILQGLASGPLADGDSPFVGFAVRRATTDFEAQYGSFKVTDAPQTPWRPATKAVVDTSSGLRFALQDDGGSTLATVVASAPEPRHLVLDVSSGDPEARRFTMGFRCDAGDRFVGFGEQSWDVDQSGQRVPVFVSEQGIGKDPTDEYKGIWYVKGRRHSGQWVMPWTLTNRGFALVAETPYLSRFDLCSERPDAGRIEVDLPFKLHLFYGPSPLDATSLATATFGRPRVPPPIAFAPWNDAVYGQDQVLGVASRLRQDDIPSSAIWTEDWRGGDTTGDNYALKEEWQVDTSLYPDMSTMTSALHAEGFKFFVYFNPFVYQDSKAWPETAPQGFLVKNQSGDPYVFDGAKFRPTGLLDPTHPGARAWAVGKMRDAMALGADGWMHDFGEWLPTDSVLAGGSGLELHNQYPVFWQQIAREALDGMNDGTQRLFFARSGWFGTPPLVDVFWAGDQRTDFEVDDGLPTVPVMGINLSVVGCPSYGHDIAGYQSLSNDPSTKELFFRWTELGAFSPVMRTHHGTKPLLEWSWEKDAETTQHFRRYAIEHIMLAPLFMALARDAGDTGIPIVRGLFLHYPEEATAWTIKDELLLGDSILVAPVVTQGATSRDVWLPAGTWFPWAGGPSMTGGTWPAVPAPVGEIPVFARAGSVVVRYPDSIRTLDLSSPGVPGPAEVGDDRDLLVFLGGDAQIVEASGSLSYALHAGSALTAGDVSYSWNGVALAPCGATPVAPCVTADDGTGATAFVGGNGTLSLAGASTASVEVKGGSAARRLSLRVRR